MDHPQKGEESVKRIVLFLRRLFYRQGEIADVRVWDRSLTAAEIQAVFRGEEVL